MYSGKTAAAAALSIESRYEQCKITDAQMKHHSKLKVAANTINNCDIHSVML